MDFVNSLKSAQEATFLPEDKTQNKIAPALKAFPHHPLRASSRLRASGLRGFQSPLSNRSSQANATSNPLPPIAPVSVLPQGDRVVVQNAAGSSADFQPVQNLAVTAATISMGRQSIATDEAAPTVRVPIIRRGNTTTRVEVDYTTTNATAMAGADYVASSGTVVFRPGETRKIIPIALINDTSREGDESFAFSLSGIRGGSLTAPRTTTIRIADDELGGDFNLNFANFSNPANLIFNGNAAAVNGAMQLTPAEANRRGSAFFRTPMTVNADVSFRTQFQFRLSGGQGPGGADGITFMLQNADAGTGALGGDGGSLGYGGIGNSLAIEFDSYRSGWDGEDNAVSVLLGGVVETPLGGSVLPGVDLNSGQAFTAWVDYNGATNRLDVYLSTSGNKPATPLLSRTVDLAQIVGTRSFVGFSGGTGGLFNNQSILNWQFSGGVVDSGPPRIEFSQPLYTVNENGTNATITIRRTGAATDAAAVDFATYNRSAIAGSDYTPVSTRLTFAPGETIRTVAVPIANNPEIERNEIVGLRLSNAAGLPLGVAEANLRILDDDNRSFVTEQLASNLGRPTDTSWLPDGTMLVALKGGFVRVIRNATSGSPALQAAPMINISPEVNMAGDRGLLSMTVHPNFAQNPYIYLLYTYDPPEVLSRQGLAGPDGTGNRPSRLVRYTVTTDGQGNLIADPNSALILLGKNSNWQFTSRPDVDSTEDFTAPPSGIVNGTTIVAGGTPVDGNGNIRDYLATDSLTHSIGTVRFGTDGNLFVSNGDGTSFGRVDPRTLRVLDPDNLSGKILRIDPNTGRGLATNPFFNNNADSNRSKVYSLGLRNPFRFAVNPANNEPYITDVGWGTWEEINAGRGANFGWPFFEGGSSGNLPTGGYADLPEADAFYRSNPNVQMPIYAEAHRDGAIAFGAGTFYTGTALPDSYRNQLFFTDLGRGNIYVLSRDEVGYSAKLFATDFRMTTSMSVGPDGNIYFTDLNGDRVMRWRFT